MTTVTDICNNALMKIGTRSTIADLNEDSNEARACTRLYANTRDEVLAMAHWNFARKTINLALLKSAPGTPTNPNPISSNVWSPDWPAPPYLFEYAYPSDCITVRFLQPQPALGWSDAVPVFGNAVTAFPTYGGFAVKFEVASDTIADVPQNVILTNQYQAIGVYTFRAENPNNFSTLFADAVESGLAGKLAIPLTGDKQLRRTLLEEANSAVIQARAIDGNEGMTIQEHTPDWLSIRDIGGVTFGPNPYIAQYGPLFTV